MTPERFVSHCVLAAADLALLFVGEPDEKVRASMHQIRTNLETKLAETFGPDIAAQIAAAFVAAVIGHRREIEAAGATPRAMN